MLLKAPQDCANACDMPNDHVLEPLGTRAQVLALLAEVYPAFDGATAPDARIFSLDDEGAEVHIPDEDPLSTLSIRPGDLEPIWRLCERLGARLLDTSSGEFVRREDG